MIYQLLFRLYLWAHVPGMSLSVALRYPTPDSPERNHAFEDARSEMSYMWED